MMQGDQYRLPVELKNSDGTPLTPNDIKDLEIFVGQFRKMLSEGNIEFEDSEDIFYVYLNQKETFMFRGEVKVQARVLFLSGDVIGIALGTLNFETSTSKVVLQ